MLSPLLILFLAPEVVYTFVLPRPFTNSIARTRVASTISSNEELLPGISAIDGGIDSLYSNLETLRKKPFFRFYSVDILASCEYMPQELFECYTESCEIYPEDEDAVRFLVLSWCTVALSQSNCVCPRFR